MAMRELFAMLARVSPSDVTVLIEGESGTGKEIAARSIHAASARASKPYVVFDCASIPRELAESELFGHKRGSFSGAIDDRLGAFQQADGGTICLDEIGELPLDLQPKLLRALETGEVKRVGDDHARKIDVRVIAATNRDLGAEANRGSFRSDLYYRLEVMKVRMPPLRHRPEDIPGLVEVLLEGKIAEGDSIQGENVRRLIAYSWPGNVRELRNALMRAVALAQRPGAKPRFAELVFNFGAAVEEPATIGISFPGVASPMPFKEAKAELVARFERAYVEALLARHRGNVRQAALAAELSRKHLYDLIHRATGEQVGDDDPE
jgi:DNA-binding NtrC family response regulator